MIIVIGLMLGCALLYFWLQGHWFARILAYPVFAIAAFLICGALLVRVTSAPHEVSDHNGAAILAVCLAAPIGWLISSLPTWYWRARMRAIAEAEMRWPHPAG